MMMDLDGIGWAHAKSISPLYAKKFMGLIQVILKYTSILNAPLTLYIEFSEK